MVLQTTSAAKHLIGMRRTNQMLRDSATVFMPHKVAHQCMVSNEPYPHGPMTMKSIGTNGLFGEIY